MMQIFEAMANRHVDILTAWVFLGICAFIVIWAETVCVLRARRWVSATGIRPWTFHYFIRFVAREQIEYALMLPRIVSIFAVLFIGMIVCFSK